MKTIEQQLYDYIEAQEDYIYTTSKGIIISSPDDDWLQAEYNWINTKDECLSIHFWSPMADFVKTLGIRNLYDIDDLAPGRILELYYDSLAATICRITLEYTHYMTFTKLGNSIVAENDCGFKHTIPPFNKVETPEQYISYTKEYYKLMECNEN